MVVGVQTLESSSPGEFENDSGFEMVNHASFESSNNFAAHNGTQNDEQVNGLEHGKFCY